MTTTTFTPQQALAMTAPTESFLCSLDANHYHIEFYRFSVRDIEKNKMMLDVQRTADDYAAFKAMQSKLTPEQITASRSIKYSFPPSMLRSGALGAKLVFGVNADQPVSGFRMIERYYFRNQLIKSFDFEFGFCIPHSTNTWEAIYDMPKLNDEWLQAIIDNPYETVSDSFYFVGNELVMHNKAFYAYNAPE